ACWIATHQPVVVPGHESTRLAVMAERRDSRAAATLARLRAGGPSPCCTERLRDLPLAASTVPRAVGVDTPVPAAQGMAAPADLAAWRLTRLVALVDRLESHRRLQVGMRVVRVSEHPPIGVPADAVPLPRVLGNIDERPLAADHAVRPEDARA